MQRDPERRSFHEAILRKVFEKAVRRLNPALPDGAVLEVMGRVIDEVFAGDLMAENRRLHGLITGGVPITYFNQGEERHERARLVDWSDRDNAAAQDLQGWRKLGLRDLLQDAVGRH